jgi:hypothetical protein
MFPSVALPAGYPGSVVDKETVAPLKAVLSGTFTGTAKTGPGSNAAQSRRISLAIFIF